MFLTLPFNKKTVFLFLLPGYLAFSFNTMALPPDNGHKDPGNISLVISINAGPRIEFGAQKLTEALKNAGYLVKLLHRAAHETGKSVIVIGESKDPLISKAGKVYGINAPSITGKEAFSIASDKKGHILVSGTDGSGALYGCLELADLVKLEGKIPGTINRSDKPEMVMRGTCIGLQKTELLPGREVYEYPYTPELFPWFYDKNLWTRYLDMMVENRFNSLYLWNGHPFASLVRVKEYPYAVEVDSVTFTKNEQMYRFVTEEANKRGIWVIQMFYNIIVSKPFAEKNHMATQDRNRPIIPLISDYTRKSIAAFVEKYRNVGLLITLGEAMEGAGQDDVDWFTKTIIPGVKDGLKASGQTNAPPIVLRAHDTDAPRVMKEALPIYSNLYTMAKYNGEALTTYTPRGSWAELHRSLSRIGTVHIENVHIMANLEPFRYGSADFIQKSVQAMHSVYEANGLHLYPQASYWDWPYTADKVQGRLLQLDRDWIWYKEWARYAWNCHRDRGDEINYWSNQLSEKYGTSSATGKEILEAYEQTGEIAPKLLRRYGITDGNRQTLTLGMFMTQLINPDRYNLFALLYESEAPEGEMITQYAEKEWNKQDHIGETPVRIAAEVTAHGRKAVEAIEKAAPSVTLNHPEFERLRNDVYCYDALAGFYSQKVYAALWVLRYRYSKALPDLEKALPYLKNSLEEYKKLTALTRDTYRYANSMQTKQRKIPIRGADGKYIHWVEMLPLFEEELNHFIKNLDSLKTTTAVEDNNSIHPFTAVPVTVSSPGQEFYRIGDGSLAYTDTLAAISAYAPELQGLKGIKISWSQQLMLGTTLKFSTTQPVKLLVGFFNAKENGFLAPPDLEHDASANNFGQSEIKIANALVAGTLPPVNIHAYSFNVGAHVLQLGRGACMLLGFIDDKQEIRYHDAGKGVPANAGELDWMFE